LGRRKNGIFKNLCSNIGGEEVVGHSPVKIIGVKIYRNEIGGIKGVSQRRSLSTKRRKKARRPDIYHEGEEKSNKTPEMR